MIQLEFPPTAPALTLTEQVRRVLLAYEWITPAELQAEILRRTGNMHSDSSLTARIRELRGSKEHPLYKIVNRRRAGSKTVREYRLEGLA